MVQKAKYIKNIEGLNDSIIATIDNKEWSVPLDSANRHYQEILEWVAKGNTIEEAD